LAFAAYILLVYKSSNPPPWWVHGIVFVAFMLLQVWHDDYLRIRLNSCAEIANVSDAKRAEEIAAIRGLVACGATSPPATVSAPVGRYVVVTSASRFVKP
jgi:hypothetical protein